MNFLLAFNVENSLKCLGDLFSCLKYGSSGLAFLPLHVSYYRPKQGVVGTAFVMFLLVFNMEKSLNAQVISILVSLQIHWISLPTFARVCLITDQNKV